jgi:hypothetical protein
LRQVNQKFEARLGYIAELYLRKEREKKGREGKGNERKRRNKKKRKKII